MRNNVSDLIRKTIKSNTFLGVIGAMILLIISDYKIALAFISGNLISTLNFSLNATIISKVFEKNKNRWLILFSYFFRITIIIFVATLFLSNPKSLTAYIAALVLQYVSILIYNKKN